MGLLREFQGVAADAPSFPAARRHVPAGQYRMRCRDSHFRTLVGVNEGLAHATGAAPLFTSAVSAFLALGPAQP